MNTLTYLSSETFSCIPSELVPDLQRMLSANEFSRPTAIDFTGQNVNIVERLSLLAYIHAFLSVGNGVIARLIMKHYN